MGTPKHPGTILKSVLVRSGLTQRELAGYCGVSTAYISDIIRGRRGLSARMAIQLGVSVGNDHQYTARFWWEKQCAYDFACAETAWIEEGRAIK